MANMVTIRQALPRLSDDGMPMSEYSLRLLIKRGAIPVRYVGKKALIFYPNIVSYLQCVDGGDNPSLGM
jgi:hypothetical protein